MLSETGAGLPQLAEPAPAVVHGGLVGEHGEQHEALAVLEGDGEEAHLHEAASELVAREQRRLRWSAVGAAGAAGAASMACMASMACGTCDTYHPWHGISMNRISPIAWHGTKSNGIG